MCASAILESNSEISSIDSKMHVCYKMGVSKFDSFYSVTGFEMIKKLKSISMFFLMFL